jgi:hypothetical protein
MAQYLKLGLRAGAIHLCVEVSTSSRSSSIRLLLALLVGKILNRDGNEANGVRWSARWHVERL